jgi:hypothetical protein
LCCPAGIACGNDCWHSYSAGTRVTLTATAGLVVPDTAADIAGIAAHWLAAIVVVVVAGRTLDRRSAQLTQARTRTP